MATASGSVALVSVDRNSAIVFLHDPTNTGPLPTGAMLWNDPQPVPPVELVMRTMWLSLVNKSLQEHFAITIFVDDVSGVATSVMLSDDVMDVAGSAVPNGATEHADLLAAFAGRNG